MAGKELVLDLETAATPSNKPGERKLVTILSIGGIIFDPAAGKDFYELMDIEGLSEEEVGPDVPHQTDTVFYSPVSFSDSLAKGFDTDKGTLEFWKDQIKYKDSYNMLAVAMEFQEDINFTFAKFDQWLRQHKVARVWGRAPSFDCTILREAFNHLGFVFPINPFHERDHRTMTDLFGIALPTHSKLIKHHALHDCAIEALAIQEMYEQMNPEEKPRKKKEKKVEKKIKRLRL